MNTQQVDHKVLKYLGFDFSKLKEVENQYRPVLDLPPEIVYMWILESQKVGNSGDVSVLERNLPAPRQSGGFTWSETHLGQEFFSIFLRNSELATLYIQDLKINGIPYDKIESSSYNILPSKILKILRKKVPAIKLSTIFSAFSEEELSDLIEFPVDKQRLKYFNPDYYKMLYETFSTFIYKLPCVMEIIDSNGNKTFRMVINVSGEECTYKTLKGEFKGKILKDAEQD